MALILRTREEIATLLASHYMLSESNSLSCNLAQKVLNYSVIGRIGAPVFNLEWIPKYTGRRLTLLFSNSA
jgi:hypothetical protein